MEQVEIILKELGIETRNKDGQSREFLFVWQDIITLWNLLDKNEKAELLVELELN